MAKFFPVIVMYIIFIAGLQAQTISDYAYKLNNGVTVRTMQGWNFIRVSQNFVKQQKPAATGKLSVKVNTVGDLIAGSEVKAMKTGTEVDPSVMSPDTYDLNVTCHLSSSTKGAISFRISGIEIKPNMDTNVHVDMFDYQIVIDEKPASNKGLAYYEGKTARYHGNWEQNLNWSKPKFYTPQDHKKNLKITEPMSDSHGRTNPGTYDICVRIENTTGPEHIIWLEGLVMKPNYSYKIVTNLNAAEVRYTGGEYEVKYLRFYRTGTAAKTKGKPQPDKKSELFASSANAVTPCPPGKYDVLLHYGNGKHVWHRNVVLELGKKTEVK